MGKDYCAITGCHNKSGQIGRFGKEVKLHHLPTDRSLRAALLRAISRKHFTPTRYTQVCSDHFPGGEGRTWKHTVPRMHLPQKIPRECNPRRTVSSSGRPCDTLENEDVEDTATLCTEMNPRPRPTTSLQFHSYHLPYVEQTDCHKTVEQEDSSGKTDEEHSLISVNKVDREVGVTEMPEITIELIKDNDIPFYTGLPNRGTFLALFETCVAHDVKSCVRKLDSSIVRPHKLRLIDEFLLVMMRLRLGLLLKDLAFRFKISESHVSSIFNNWITFLYAALQSIVFIPSLSQTHIPKCFEMFNNTRIVLDCTEVFIETPSSLENKSKTYSHYKSHNTFKALIGISMTGAVTLVSKLYGGCTSDVEITRKSGLYDNLVPGDAVMADKGFIHIEQDLKKIGVQLYVPPLKMKQQLTKSQVELTRRIASARIHVERKMAQIKKFRILHGILPLSLSQSANEIFFICSALTNFMPPLVK